MNPRCKFWVKDEFRLLAAQIKSAAPPCNPVLLMLSSQGNDAAGAGLLHAIVRPAKQ
jgi:hypothetical protein